MDGADTATGGEESEPTYKLSLEGAGMTLKRGVPEQVALDIIAAVMGGSAAAGPARRSSARDSAGRVDRGGAAQSLREHLNEIEAKRNVDKILGIAVYLANSRGSDEFTPEAVKREFRNAGEPTPANFSRDFRAAVSAGWVAEATDEPGTYYVTTTGRDAIHAKFSRDFQKASRVNKPSRRKRARGKNGEG